MAFDFPPDPAVGQLYPATAVVGQPQYEWDGTAWMPVGLPPDYFLEKAGDTMQGDLLLNANPTALLGAATKQYVDNRQVTPTDAVRKSGETMTGLFTTAGSGGAISQATLSNSIQVMSISGSGHCFMSFHAQGYFAGNLGLLNNGYWYVGGQSFGNAAYQMWTSRDFTAYPVSNARLPYAGDYYLPGGGGVVEPFYATVMTGLTINAGIHPRHRYLQWFSTGWFDTYY